MGAIAMSLKLSAASSSDSLDTRLPKSTTVKISSASPWLEETKGRVAKLLEKNEISISPYDTAWVGMVASPFSKAEPCFPDSLFWLLENQCHDGSWARPHHHSRLNKDVLSSTLASLLALKKWGLGHHHVHKGLHFVEMNFGWATDESQITPVGFEIIFPAMLDEARALSLNPALDQTTLNDLMNLRELELKRINSSTGKEAYMAYIGEGLMGKMESKDILKYQRKNGSLFNSPSSTAAAFIALPHNSHCLDYLNCVVNKFGGAVPAVYPLNIYSQLCIADNLERLGISRYFIKEIRTLLDQTYRYWLLGDEEIFMDASTCALAFKLLRMNGYPVTSDAITQVIKEQFPSSGRGEMTADVSTALQLFRASQLMLHPHETELENQNLRLRSILEHELSNNASTKSSRLNAEVKHALDFPFYAIMERMATRKNIEHYDFDDTRMLKTSYRLPNLGNKDLYLLSVEDFNRCQAIHREEFKEFERWFVEQKLDEMEFAMNKFVYCYFTAAATMFAPEQSHARMSWAKHALLISVADDLYDVRGSYQEKKKLIQLLHLWDVDVNTEERCCSNNVRVIFSALKNAICETADKGSKLQGRDVTGEIIGIWLDCLNAFMKEAEWEESHYVPSFDEYMSNAYVSYGLGPVVKLPLYLVGPKLSEEMVNRPDYRSLFKLMSTHGRLANDVRGDERERQQGKVSGVALYIAQNGGGEMSTEAAISEMLSSMRRHMRELLKLVLEENDDTTLPKPCKELFWDMSRVNQLFFKKDDGFWSKELTLVARQIIQHPIIAEEDGS